MMPSEYGSPYKGVFFGNKSRATLSRLDSRLGSRMGSRIESRMGSRLEPRPLIGMPRRVENGLDLVLKSITMGLQGVQSQLEKTETNLNTYQNQFNVFVRKMALATKEIHSIIQNTRSEFDTRPQIIEKLSQIITTYFSSLETFAQTELSDKKPRYEKKSSSVIPSMLSSSPIDSGAPRPLIKILMPGSMTPNPPMSSERSKRVKADGESKNAFLAKQHAVLGGVKTPEGARNERISALPTGVQTANVQMSSPKREQNDHTVSVGINPKELRLRLQRIESSASHGSRHGKEHNGTSTTFFKPEEQQKITRPTTPHIPPLPNLESLANKSRVSESNKSQLNIPSPELLPKVPSQKKLQTQTTLEKQYRTTQQLAPNADIGHHMDIQERITIEEESLLKSEDPKHKTGAKGDFVDPKRKLGLDLPSEHSEPLRLESQANLKVDCDNSRSHDEIDLMMRGAISPILAVPRNSLGILRQGQTFGKIYTEDEGVPVASRFVFADQKPDCTPEQTFPKPNQIGKEDVGRLPNEGENSDDGRNLALDLLNDMKTRSFTRAKDKEATVFPSISNHDADKTQQDLDKLGTSSRNMPSSIRSDQPKDLSQGLDETVSRFQGTGRLKSAVPVRGTSPKLRLIQETDYPEFSSPRDRPKKPLVNIREPVVESDDDLMDYEKEPSSSRQNSILVYQSTSSKNYRVSSRSASSVSHKQRGLQQNPSRARKAPQVVIKKSVTREDHHLGVGKNSSYQRTEEMNFLDVPGKHERPGVSKGFFTKQKKQKPSAAPRELSVPSPGHRAQRQSLDQQERSHRQEYRGYPENRMTINLAVNPRVRSSDIDVGLTLHLGSRREQSGPNSRVSQERTVESRGFSSRGRKYP